MKPMKALALVSGGIDSPVAAYLMVRKGLDLTPLYFDNRPQSDRKAMQRSLATMRAVGFRKAWILPHSHSLDTFACKCDFKFICVMCKRMMLRTAEALALRLGAEALVTGESLAQVASQTAPNMYVESQAVKIPVIRPLIGLDKEETIAIAKRIGTYPVSITPAICCTHAPDRPATAARLEKILAEEAKVDIPLLVKQSLEGAKKVVL
jgi:thiamine biosynthesis protein ThiI